jgi:hypothetical protein
MPFILLLILVFNSLQVLSQDQTKNFIDLNFYGDTRGFGTFTPNLKLDLSQNFSYFGFANINFHGDGQVLRYYTENNIYYQIPKTPFYLAQQYVSLSGTDNDLLRYGPRIIVSDLKYLKKLFKKINLYYELSAFPLQIDHSDGFDMGFEHFYIVKIFPKFFDDRLYLSGFLDHNLEFGELSKSHSILVSENQLGFRLVNDLFLVSELRYNGYLSQDELGVGLGLEWFWGS